MKKAVLFIILFTIQTFAVNTDYQFWGGYGFQHKFNNSFKLLSEGENRFRDNSSENNFNKASIELNYYYKSWLDMGVTYQRSNIKGAEWVPEQKPVLRINFKYHTGPWELSNQQKFEYRIRKDHYNIKVYKNRTQITSNCNMNGKSFLLYLNEEIFYNVTDSYLNLNRIRFGTQVYITKYLKPDIGLVFQSNNQHTYWDHLLGFAIKLWIVL